MERLERISNENLVWFYREELESVDNGESAALLIPSNVRRRLVRIGILEDERGRGKGLILNPEAKEILENYRKVGHR